MGGGAAAWGGAAWECGAACPQRGQLACKEQASPAGHDMCRVAVRPLLPCPTLPTVRQPLPSVPRFLSPASHSLPLTPPSRDAPPTQAEKKRLEKERNRWVAEQLRRQREAEAEERAARKAEEEKRREKEEAQEAILRWGCSAAGWGCGMREGTVGGQESGKKGWGSGWRF